ncbi:hypothetical protein QR680_004705 [Steinernema hermaphroditum]|uniref:Nematode Specific Peptide family, group B n=1 Tax=Steinernema hermaphroditum TaxID=289476 RepID=A0AA39LU45_9BILA|nr:hypothetical protein QR680_004705 [Steinernema hermaphroditum]
MPLMSSFKSVASIVFVCAFMAISFQPSDAQFYYAPRLWSSYRALYAAPAYYNTPYYVPSYSYVIGSNKQGAPEGPSAGAFKPSSGLTNNQ